MSAPRCTVAVLVVAFLSTGWTEAQENAAAAVPTEGESETSAPEPKPEPVSELPVAVEKGHFTQFLSHSPFLRTLNLEETYALRGIAEIDGVQVATLYNRHTKKSLLVTANQMNAERMQLKEVSEADFLNGVSATIAVADEEMNLKFEPERIAPGPKNPGGKGPSSSGSSSEHRGPSQQDIDRYKALPPEKQEKLKEYIRQTMQRYPDMSREERGNMIRGAVTRLSDGGDISLPAPPSGGSATTPPPASNSGSSSSSSPRR